MRGKLLLSGRLADAHERQQRVESSRLPLGMNWPKAALGAAPDLKWESRWTSRDD